MDTQQESLKLKHDDCDCARIAEENKKEMCPTIFLVRQWTEFYHKESQDNQLFNYKYDTYSHYVQNFGNLYCRCAPCIKFLVENDLYEKNIRNELSPAKLQKTYCPGSYSRFLYFETKRDAIVANASDIFKERVKNVTLEISIDISLFYCHCDKCRQWSEEFVPVYIKRTLAKK